MPKTSNDFKIEAGERFYAESGGTLTNFQPFSVLNALCAVIGQVASEIAYAVEMWVRRMFLSSADGKWLDLKVENEYNITRLGAMPYGVILWFYGSGGSTIPADTEISNNQGDIVYRTVNEATLGSGDHGRIRVDAVSTKAGSSQYAMPYTLIKFVDSAPAGITKVENRTASAGGGDQEEDAAYKVRAVNSLATLEQETQDWYTATAQEWNPAVIRAFVVSNGQAMTLYVAKSDGTNFSAGDLTELETYVSARLKADPNRSVTAANISWTDFTIEATGVLKSSYTLTNVVEAFASRLDKFLIPSQTEPGKNIDATKLLTELYNTGMFDNIVEGTFVPATDVVVANNSLPRATSINLTDSQGNSLAENHNTYVVV